VFSAVRFTNVVIVPDVSDSDVDKVNGKC